jgi:nitroreductase
VVVAELKGIPPVAQQDIAYCLENMWLNATALGLGFQLVSALSMLAGEVRFWDLAGLPPDTFDVNGCAVGTPATVPGPRPRQTVDEATTWMA